jgi:hypothetical protein
MIYDIEKELPGRRAIIKGEFKDLHSGTEVIIRDSDGNLYDAVCETRGNGGITSVNVRGILVD